MIGYLIKSGVLLTVFHAFFILFMRRTTFFRFNRIMLLLGTAICMLIPVVDINVPAMANNIPHIVIPEVYVGNNIADSSSITFGWKTACILLYLSGAIIVFVLMLKSLLKTYAVIRQGTLKIERGYTLRIIDEDIPSFSFLHTIVISKHDYEEHPIILEHEAAHISRCHTYDLLLFSVVTLIHWFNPLVWMARSELMMLHEYEADDSIIQQGIDATQYQLLLVKKAVGTQRFQLANGFNHTKLKNRITMMHTKKTNKWMRLGYAFCIPMLLGTLCFCTNRAGGSTEEESVQTAETVTKSNEEQTVSLQQLDEKPQFEGGEAGEFVRWVSERLVYPKSAKESGISGRILLSFTVNPKGKVTDVRVISGVDEALDAEAVRVVSQSPEWTPGKIDGKAVPVAYTIPVVFVLK
ncbi:MAG: M56 family metallopeptidase [Bacteroidales bacterium]|nr:M56 family metallopeptidase [Bacteroidales bacterium]